MSTHNRIPSKELLGHEIAVGEQTHVDHLRCPAGSDTRQRLYIKRLGTDAYVGHCFNCGGSGYHFGNTPSRVQDLVGRREGKGATSSFPLGYTTTVLPLHVKEYLHKYALDDEEAEHLGYKYHEASDSLVMPYYQCRKAVVQSYQQRYMGDNVKFRYSTHEEKSYAKCSVVTNIPSTGFPKEYAVLTEDQISAYRVWRESGGKIHSTALLGTNLNTEVISILTTIQPKKLLIWMDADAAGIMASREISKTLVPILKNTKISHMGFAQPKDLSVEELKEHLNVWMT